MGRINLILYEAKSGRILGIRSYISYQNEAVKDTAKHAADHATLTFYPTFGSVRLQISV